MSDREWKAVEYEIVSKMAVAGKTDADIGSVLNRTSQSVFYARKRLGIPSLNVSTTNPWSIDDVHTLRAWFDMGRTDSEIAHALNRTTDSIISKRNSLGLERRPLTVPASKAPVVRRGIKAADILGGSPLRPEDKDYTRRAYANAAFLISLLRAGHKPGQGEFVISSDARCVPLSRDLSFSPMGSQALSCTGA